jgi:hypothetical protein
MKKIAILIIGCLFFSTGLYSVELGLIGGTITEPSHMNYGISAGMGLLVPLVKSEFELTRKVGAEEPEIPNTITGGIKFRPQFGKFWPYAVVGIGMEFRSIGFDFDDYEGFTFLGVGIHYKVMVVMSLRADIRFLNFSGYNRARFSAGVFFHL